MFDVLVNGHRTSDYQNIWVANIPKIQSSTTERDRYTVPQRDGDLLSAYYRRTSAYIEVTFHALNILQNMRVIKSVFCNQINEGLKTSLEYPTISILNNNVYDSYFNIKNATITEEELRDDNYGRVTIQYEVEPFEYAIEDIEFEENIQAGADTVYLDVNNDGDLCKPIIMAEYTASGSAVNWGISVRVDRNAPAMIYEQSLTRSVTVVCDSNYMYTYAIRDYVMSFYENHFTGHNYEDLWIPHGEHTIALSGYGGTTKVNVKLRRGYAI